MVLYSVYVVPGSLVTYVFNGQHSGTSNNRSLVARIPDYRFKVHAYTETKEIFHSWRQIWPDSGDAVPTSEQATPRTGGADYVMEDGDRSMDRSPSPMSHLNFNSQSEGK